MRAITLLFLASLLIAAVSLWSATGVNAAGKKNYYDYQYNQKKYYDLKSKSSKDYGKGDMYHDGKKH